MKKTVLRKQKKAKEACNKWSFVLDIKNVSGITAMAQRKSAKK
jgi:hypothetical protein